MRIFQNFSKMLAFNSAWGRPLARGRSLLTRTKEKQYVGKIHQHFCQSFTGRDRYCNFSLSFREWGACSQLLRNIFPSLYFTIQFLPLSYSYFFRSHIIFPTSDTTFPRIVSDFCRTPLFLPWFPCNNSTVCSCQLQCFHFHIHLLTPDFQEEFHGFLRRVMLRSQHRW